MKNLGKDYNEFVRIGTPVVTPLPFGGFYRLAAKVWCVKCDRDSIQVLRIHRIQMPSFLLDTVIEKPIPSDTKIMTSFMLRACDNIVGCWRTCRPWTHMKTCGHPGECRCARSLQCSCPQGCGNKGIHPCDCGRMFDKNKGKHRVGCSVGLYKRHSSFSVEHVRSQLIAPRGKA